jgi:pyrroline-5-carboxylate reductase
VVLVQADKMSALGASTGKQKEDAERLMADALRSAEDLLHSSGQAVEGMRKRYAQSKGVGRGGLHCVRQG